MKKSVLLLLLFVSLVSCKQNTRFQVTGNVKDAVGEMLYIEHTGLLKTTTIDSVKLDAKGDYKFQSKRPAYPDFYRLRLNNKVIAFSVDSCEDIIIDAKSANFATDYEVKGSDASKLIQRLRISVMDIQRKANDLTADLSAQEKSSRIASIELDIMAHKELARKLILQNPRSTAAYYAIYQKVNDTYLFSPYIKKDKPYCAAVATSYNAFMPDYERTKNLYSLVMDAIKTERKAKQDEAWSEVLKTSGTGYIDIALNDKNNEERKLSELVGKLILIDFSAYEAKESVNYTFALRDLYNKYHAKGFEIYQISLDQNKLLWQQSTKNIPWICVRDENGPNSTYVASYNISSIPTTFLMTKQGTIVARSLGFKELEQAIAKNL
ncbi:MAG: thioredoxin-like domain-containing protein [Paludibacter sp.]